MSPRQVDAHPSKLSHLLQALQVSAAVTEHRGLAVPLGGFYTELGSLGKTAGVNDYDGEVPKSWGYPCMDGFEMFIMENPKKRWMI